MVFGGLHRGLRKVSVVNGDESFDYFIPRGKQLNVVNGDHVKAGDLITQVRQYFMIFYEFWA